MKEESTVCDVGWHVFDPFVGFCEEEIPGDNIEPEIFSPALRRYPDTMNNEVFSSGLLQATVEKEFDHAERAHLELPGRASTFHGGQQLCKRGIGHVR